MAKIWPSLTQPNDLDIHGLSKIDQVVQAYASDSLVHNKISARLFDQIVRSAQFIQSSSGSFELDGLVYHGDKDPIISFDVTHQFATSILGHVQFRRFENVLHEPHNDTEQEEVLRFVGDWLKDKSG